MHCFSAFLSIYCRPYSSCNENSYILVCTYVSPCFTSCVYTVLLSSQLGLLELPLQAGLPPQTGSPTEAGSPPLAQSPPQTQSAKLPQLPPCTGSSPETGSSPQAESPPQIASLPHAGSPPDTGSPLSLGSSPQPLDEQLEYLSQDIAFDVTVETDSVEAVFSVDDVFKSFDELKEKINVYQKKNAVQLWTRDSRTIKAAQKRVNRYLDKRIRYYELTYGCLHGGRKFQAKGEGKRATK